MADEPQLIDRPYRTYAAVRRTVGEGGFPEAVDSGFPVLDRWMAAHGLEAAGPGLIRYRAEQGDTYVVDLGIPVEGDLPDGGDGVSIERLAAGRYVMVRHVGSFDGLTEAHARIDSWAAEHGVALDEDLGLRIEHYVVDPSGQPDPSKWVTEVEQLVAVGARPTRTTSIDGYGVAARDWGEAHRRLADSVALRERTFLSTASPDGRPHAVPVGALWLDGAWWFTSGPGTRKSKDLAADPRCVVSVALDGMDVVVEGRATRVTDEATLVRVAAVYSSQGWPASAVAGDGAGFTAAYSAPSAGPPPWYLYRVDPEVVFGFGTAEPYGATRWQF
jgi:effector-binding domain-containing protein